MSNISDASQSLSSRAMSFDLANELKQDCTLLSLNPFRAGRCLSTQKWWDVEVVNGLNPFRAGRCLSTKSNLDIMRTVKRLNPFRAGRCLSTELVEFREKLIKSQSLSSRAMSFDWKSLGNYMVKTCLNPFRAGRCLSTQLYF